MWVDTSVAQASTVPSLPGLLFHPSLWFVAVVRFIALPTFVGPMLDNAVFTLVTSTLQTTFSPRTSLLPSAPLT